MNPARQLIEQAFAAGDNVQVFVDARRNDVVGLPEYLREKYKEHLVLNFFQRDKSNLNFDFGKTGFSVTLSFHPTITRVTIPYEAVWVVKDVNGHNGFAIQAHQPALTLPASLSGAKRPAFQLIKGGKS